MERRYLFAAMLSLAILTFCFSYLDIVQSFSSKYMVWDSIEHFLGGVTVGLFSIFAIVLIRSRAPMPAVVIMTLCVGIAWEIMEYQIGTGGSQYMSYGADTAKDIVLDGLGGYTAFHIGQLLRNL